MMQTKSADGWVFVFAGAAVAGTLDILYAIVFWKLKTNAPPMRILQSVATGLLGTASFRGGSGTAALGLALHFLIALIMSGVYYAAAKHWPLLRQQPILCGAIYGLILYAVMNYIVVPLSAARPGPKDALWVVLSILVHMMLIGVPIALFTRRAMTSGTS